MARQKRVDPRKASDVDRQIGARVRARRVELGMSQGGLADEIGVTFQQIQKYERGVNRIAAATLMAIADALDVSVPALLPRAGGASEAIAIDDPEALELMSLFMRLSREGRRVLLGLTRSLGADPKLGSKG